MQQETLEFPGLLHDVAFSWRPGRLLCGFFEILLSKYSLAWNKNNITSDLWVPQLMNSRLSSPPPPHPPLPSANSKKDVSVDFWRPYLCPWKDTNIGVSIESLINLDKTFFRISRIRVIAPTSLSARRFIYLSSFISQILDFLYWLVCIFIVDGVTVKLRRQGLHRYTMLGCHLTKTQIRAKFTLKYSILRHSGAQVYADD